MADEGIELDPKYDNYDYPIIAPVVQSGHPGHLTPQQQAQVHQLRMMLEAQGYTKRLDSLTLVRYNMPQSKTLGVTGQKIKC